MFNFLNRVTQIISLNTLQFSRWLVIHTIAFFLLATIGFTQQLPLFDQYYLNEFINNPANTGNSGTNNLFLLHHAQWGDFPGAPVSSMITCDGMLENKKTGIGAIIFSDKTGLISRIGASGSYSYKASFSETSGIVFGLALGFSDHQLDLSKATIPTIDPLVTAKSFHNTAPEGNLGFNLVLNKFELGAAVPQFMNNKVTFSTPDQQTYFQLNRHYLISSKFTFGNKEESKVLFTPSFLMRISPTAGMQFDINMLLDFVDKAWIAASYKQDFAMVFNAGIRLNKQFSIGYAYDLYAGDVLKFSGLSHEILVSYKFGKPKETDENEEVSRKPEYPDIANKQLLDKMDSLKNKVNNLENQLKFIAANQIGDKSMLDIDGDGVPDSMDMDPFTEKGVTVDERGIALDADKDGVPDSRDEEPNTISGALVNSRGISVTIQSAGAASIYFPPVFFDSRSDTIKYESNYENIAIIARAIKWNPGINIKIVGNTDPAGSDDFNLKLGLRRADALRNYLLKKYQLSAERITAESKGEAEPLTPGISRINRRVDVYVR